MLPIALQLYSVRDHLERDVRETLDKVKAAGYDRVEPFGLDPDAAAEWMALLGAAGLQAVASHVDYELVRDDPDRAAEMAKIIGYEDLVVPWVMVDTAEEWVQVAGVLDEAGARLRAQGLRLGYHNHDHEFEPIGDTTPFDILFEYAAPENLFLELDVRWAGEHGGDPVAIIEEFGSRCRFLHLKEKPASGVGFTEIGRGVLDWDAIVAAGRAAGVQAYVVEQDESGRDSIESARISAEFLARY